MRNPWEVDWSDPAQVQQMTRPRAPRIQGPPREAPLVRPIQERTDQLQAQEIQSGINRNPDEEREATARRRIAEAQAIEAERRAADPTGALGVEQSRATGFYSRGTAANRAYERLGVGAPPLEQTIGRALLPERMESYILPERREEAEANQRGFISSVLRYESGAAIPPDEFASAQRTYFPQPGDEPGTVAAKARLRAEALEALRIGSGPGQSQVRTAPRLNHQELNARLERLITAGDREGAMRLLQENGASVEDPRQLDRALRERRGRVEPGDLGTASVNGPGLMSQIGGAFQNVAAGLGQGAASLVDIPARAMGSVLGTATDIIPGVPEWVSDELRNTRTIGGEIERLSPTPNSRGAGVARFGANLLGGAAALPRSAVSALANRFGGTAPMRPPPPPGPTRRQIMNDARQAQVPMMPADVGGPATRLMTAAVAQTPGGATPIVGAGQRTIAAGQAELGRIAGRFGRPTNAEEAGETATAGALRYRSSSRDEVSRLYDTAIRAAGDTRVVPTRALGTLDRNIAELAENPAADDTLGYLTSLRDTLQTRFPEGVTVAGIRGMRTQLRDRFFREGLRGSDIERRAMQVVDEASNDLADALTTAGRSRAATAFRTADAAHAARVSTLDEIIMPIIGRRGERSGTQVFQALNAAARGNGPRLAQFLRTLPEEEAGTARASIINGLGRASSGQQGAEGTTFSLNQFLTHWDNLTPAARNALFPGEARDAIQRLARIAEHTKAASRYANTSRTGGVMMAGATAGTTLAGFPALAATLAGQYAAGRLLASPHVARVLAAFGSARTPRQAAAAIRRLGPIAARNPALANDIGDLQRRLTEAMSTSPALRAAAEEDRDIR